MGTALLFSANEISVSASSQPASRVPIHRYYSPQRGDHFFTQSFNELRFGSDVFDYQGIGFYLAKDGNDGAVPLYRYNNGDIGVQDHLYTTNVAEIGTIIRGAEGRDGYVFEGITGYCFTEDKKSDDMVPLYRYFNAKAADHHYTANPSENSLLRKDTVREDAYWRLKKRSCNWCNIPCFVLFALLNAACQNAKENYANHVSLLFIFFVISFVKIFKLIFI